MATPLSDVGVHLEMPAEVVPSLLHVGVQKVDRVALAKTGRRRSAPPRSR